MEAVELLQKVRRSPLCDTGKRAKTEQKKPSGNKGEGFKTRVTPALVHFICIEVLDKDHLLGRFQGWDFLRNGLVWSIDF
jgi:hypothetical protein